MNDSTIEERAGRCYELAGQALMEDVYRFPRGNEISTQDLILVHGFPRLQKDDGSAKKGSKYGHAWLEYTHVSGLIEICFDPITLYSTPKELYYFLGKIDELECRKYQRDEALVMMGRHLTYGYWGEEPEDAIWRDDEN